MKKILIGLTFLVSLTFLSLLYPSPSQARSYRSKSSDVYVSGYYRKNGTYVQPHYRSKADGIIQNNYSCIDNGRCGSTQNIGYSLDSNTPPSCPAHSKYSYGNCVCDEGYEKDYLTGKCSLCPTNSKYSYGMCICKLGYHKNYSTGQCEKVQF